MLSLGRPGNELGYSTSWPSGETPRLTRGKRMTKCCNENSSPCLLLPDTNRDHLLNARQTKATLIDTKMWKIRCWICSKPFTVRLQEDDALPPTPKEKGDPQKRDATTHLLTTHLSRWSSVRKKTPWQKVPRARKDSSIPIHEEVTKFLLVTRRFRNSKSAK